MTTTKRPFRTAIAATLLTGCLTGGTALATAAPALAAPVTTASTATNSSTPIAGSDASSRQVVAAWFLRFRDFNFALEEYQGASDWVDRLERGDDPTQVLAEFLTAEASVDQAVNDIYLAYLDRSADEGASYWVDGVTSGAFPLEWVEQNVAASDQYLLRTSTDGAKDGGGGNQSNVTVEGWYAAVLDRSPSSGERAYWLDQFGSDSALGVFRQLWYTPEAVEKRIQSHYSTLLDRKAGSGEVAYWYDREVASDAAVVAAIGSSTEYADRAADADLDN